MATLEEIMAQRSSMSLAAPVLAPLPKTKLQEKKDRLFGAPEVPAVPTFQDTLDNGNGGNSNRRPDLGDRFESGLYKSGGSLADMGKSISNSLFDTQFDDSVETGWSRQANQGTGQASAADEMAGVSFDQRQAVNQDLQGVMNTYVEDGLFPAFGKAIPEAFGVIADSGSSLLEMAAGALAAPIGGAGVALLAKKAKNTFDLVGRIDDSYDKAKESIKAVKFAKDLAGIVAKRSTQASVLTADLVQQTKVEYEQETGEKMSPQRLVGTTMAILATSAMQIQSVKMLYLPGSKSFVGNTVKQKFTNEMKQMSKYLEQGAVKSIAKRIGGGLGAVFAAGGAEAVQEYSQTWAQILSVHMDPEEAGGLFASAYKELNDQDNQNEAEVAAILGSVAGGGIKSTLSAPGLAVGAVGDVTAAVGNKIVRSSYNAARDRLNPSDQEADIEERKNLRAAAQEIQTESARKVAVVSDSGNFQNVSDEAVKAEMVRVAAGRNLSDPKVFEDVSNKLVRSYKADSVTALYEEKLQNGFIAGRKVVNRVADDFAKILDLSPEEIQAVKDYVVSKVESTKEFGQAFADDVKNFKSSATLGVAEAAVDFISESVKENTKKGVEYANSKESVQKLKSRLESLSSVDSARSLATSLETNSPDNSKNAVREIRNWADQKEKDQKRVNIKNDSALTYDNLGDSVKEASQIGATVTNPRALSIELSNARKGSIEDMETLQSLENALENYKKTNFSKTGEDALTEAAVKNIARKLASARTELESRPDASVANRAKAAASTVTGAASKATAWAKPATDKLKSMGITTVDKLVDLVTNEDVFVAEDTPQQKYVISEMTKTIKNILESKEGTTGTDVDQEALLQSRTATIMKEDTETADKKPDKGTFGEKNIKGLSKAFKTSNPDYLMAIMERIFPVVREPSLEKILRDRMSEVLKDSTEPNTEPTRQRKKSVDQTDTNNQNESDVVVEEDGAVFRSAPDMSKVNAKMVEILGNHICKV
jgi:hypothetical protein